MKMLLRLFIALSFSVSSIRTQSDTALSSVTATPNVSSLPGSTPPPTFTLTGRTVNGPTSTAPDVPPGFTTAGAASTEARPPVTMTTTRNNTTELERSPNPVQVNTSASSSASTAGSPVTSDPSVLMIAHQSANTNTTSNPPATGAAPAGSICQAVPGWAIALLVLASAVLLLLLLLLLALLLWFCCRTRRKGLVVFEQQNQPTVIPLNHSHTRWDQTNGGNQDALAKAARSGTYTITEQ